MHHFAPPNPTVKRLISHAVRAHGEHNLNQQDEKMIQKTVRTIAKKLKKQSILEQLDSILANANSGGPCIPVSNAPDHHRHQMSTAQRKNASPHFVCCRLWRWPELKSPAQLRSLPHCQLQCSSAEHNPPTAVCCNPYHYERPQSASLPAVFIPQSAQNYAHFSRDAQMAGQCSTPTVSNALADPDHVMDTTSNAAEPSAAMMYYSQASPLSSHGSPNAGYLSDDLDPTASGHNSPVSFGATNNDQSMDTMEDLMLPEGSRRAPDGSIAVEYYDLPEWCSIHYSEMSTRVGDTFKGSDPEVLVDGFTATPDSGRLCLGALTHCDRTAPIIETRKHIGAGIKLTYANGEVTLECLSAAAVFVQCPSANILYGFAEETVVRVPTGGSLRLFSTADFGARLREAVPQGFKAISRLIRFCSLRISFVKGWGENYHRRMVTQTPCWIEVYINSPMRWLDCILQVVDGPTEPGGTSRT